MQLIDYLSLGRQTYDYFSDGILILDSSSKIVYCNRSIVDLFGYSINELEGYMLADRFEEADKIVESIKQTKSLRNKNVPPKELTFPQKNGKKIKAYTLVSALANKKLYVGYLIIVQHPQIAMEINPAIIQHYLPYIKVLNLKKDEFFYISNLKTGRNIYCSESVEKFLGWEAANFVTWGWAFAATKTHPEDVHLLANYYKKRERWKKKPFKYDHLPLQYEYRILHKRQFYVHVKITAMLLQRDENNDPLYVISFGRTYIPSEQILLAETATLSERETQLLQLLENGNSYKMAAAELDISINSVRTYIRRIYQKLNVHSVTEAINKAYRK